MSSVMSNGTTAKPNGVPVLDLIDIKGIPYAVEPIPAGFAGHRAYRLIKQAGKGEIYDVVWSHDGLILCDCPSYEFTIRGISGGFCKHGRRLVDLGYFWPVAQEGGAR